MRTHRLLAQVFFLFLLLPIFTNAQFDTSSLNPVTGNSTSLVLSPATPIPNDKITIAIESYETNIDNALISWTVDGQTVKNGVGEKYLEVYMGNIGTSKIVKASVTGGGINITKSITLKPADVDLLWQGRGYAPPLYKGRNLWANQGFLTLIAIPHVVNSSGSELSLNNFVYRWTKNGEILGGISGRGKNSLTFADSVLNLPQDLSVEVFDGNALVASKTITLHAQNPKVLVYENNPLLGYMFNYESGSGFNLNKPEVTFASFPFFFSALTRFDPSLSFGWSSSKTTNSESTNEIVYRIPENTKGTSYIKSIVKNNTQMLQGGSRDFLVQFGSNNEF